MHHIIICGDCGDRELTKTIRSACRHYGGTISFDGERIEQDAEDPAFMVLNVNALTEIRCSGLLIFGEALCQVSPKLKIGEAKVIFDGGNAGAVRLLSETGKPVIGCSLSGRDTVSFSSMTENSGLVSIQRTLTTLGGQIIEPSEICVRYHQGGISFPILASCCALLLCDIPYEDGYILS